MKKEKLDRIVNIIREMMGTTGAVGGSVNTPNVAPGFSETSPAEGPTAGLSKVMKFVRRRQLGRWSQSVQAKKKRDKESKLT